MKKFKIITLKACIAILVIAVSVNLNAQFEITNDSGDGAQLDISKFGTPFIELIPPGDNIMERGSTINMYKNNVFSPKSRTVRLSAGNEYGSLTLSSDIVDLPSFNDANNNTIPSTGHPYSMLRLERNSSVQSNAFSWSFGVYDEFEFAGSAGGFTDPYDCQNCLSLAYETGGFGAMYQFSFGDNGNFQMASDARLKENISDVSSSLNKLMELSPKKYHYIWSDKNHNRKSSGFLAQDVQKVFPDLVSSIRQPNGERTLMMNYIGLIPHITKGLQEQQDIIDEQANEISNQEDQIAKLITIIEKLQTRVDALEN